MMMPTALLICMENTFWNIGDGNFVKSFKKSFSLYIESGTRKATEADIALLPLANQSQTYLFLSSSELDEFMAKFHKIILDHCLRKFHYCFYLHLGLMDLNTFFCINTAHPMNKASGSELERKNEKKVTRLQSLITKIRR